MKKSDRNLATVICFGILAVIFQKWWIIFFSLLYFAVYNAIEDDDEE